MYKISRPLYDNEYKYKGDNYEKFIQGRKKWVNMIKRLPTKAPEGIKFTQNEVELMLGGNAQRIFEIN